MNAWGPPEQYNPQMLENALYDRDRQQDQHQLLQQMLTSNGGGGALSILAAALGGYMMKKQNQKSESKLEELFQQDFDYKERQRMAEANKPKEPIKVGNVLLDPETYQPLYEPKQKGNDRPFVVGGNLVGPDGKVIYQGPKEAKEPKGPSALQEKIDLARQLGASDDDIRAMVLGGDKSSSGPKAPAGYRFTEDGSALEAIPGGPVAGKAEQAVAGKKEQAGYVSELLDQWEQSLDGGTLTGPIDQYLPGESRASLESLTAQLAPEIKKLQRAAGEGVFTDKDAELLLKSLPTTDKRESVNRQAIQNIRAKLRSITGENAPQGNADDDLVNKYL